MVVSVEASGSIKLERFVSDVKSLKADFTQESFTEAGFITRTSSGEFTLSKPGKFSWNYTTPYVQKIIANGEHIWIYDPDLEQVTIKPFSAAMSASPIALLTQSEGLADGFIIKDIAPEEIKQGDDGLEGDNGLEWVSLESKMEEADFQNIHIGLDDIGIKAMNLFDQFGQETRIRFQQIEINPVIDNQIYDFTPPEGVDVFGGKS